ncbi:LOW QUALITY PROTEIN: NTPase KAP family P-loop domain-containing protein 1 [Ciconia maguari]
MREEMAQREAAELRRSHQKPRSPEGWGLLLALWYLAFYKPIITEGHLRRRNIEFIFIRFSAWQYAGCDKALGRSWSPPLCDSIRHHFGALPLSVYHVMGTRPRFASGFSQKEWVLKRGTCLKLWGMLFVLGAGLSILWWAAPSPRSLGSSLVLGAFSVLKNLLVSEKQKIERLTNSERFASQLGFMSKVRREVEVLVDFLPFMEIFERRRAPRGAGRSPALDICYPEKVAGVLKRHEHLCSPPPTPPFIFILAVDPSVIVPCLEQTGCMKGLADNGYLYLNRTVTLPFFIPEMGARSRLRCLEAAVQTREDLMYRIITSNVERRQAKCRGVPVAPAGGRRTPKAVRCIHEAFRCLHDGTDPPSPVTLPTNGAHVRRIVNTIPITLRLLLHRAGTPDASPRAAAAWVVLANQWPCRLSWALQWPGGRLENVGELSALRQPLHNVLSLDGDHRALPDLPRPRLPLQPPTTPATFLGVTVNLDHSIRHIDGAPCAASTACRKPPPAAPVSRSVPCPHPERR